MTDREKHIKNLSYIMDSMPDDACGDWRDSLAYAISSLKTDEAYQLMYEGEEIYTKADLVAMLIELRQDIIAESWHIESLDINANDLYDLVVQISDVGKIIQEKINSLKENEDGRT